MSPRRARHAHAVAPPARRPRVAVVTVSDSRRGPEDRGGAAVERIVRRHGAETATRAWVRDEQAAIRRGVRAALARPDVDLVVVTGGTGIAARDVTPEALRPLLDRELPGFGERFRARSEAQVGAAAWLSRAGAGTASGRLVVWLPGSVRAVELAMEELLMPELSHALRLLGRLETGE